MTSLRVILAGKGSSGTDGTDGTWDEAGSDGVDGLGGKVWSGTISINDGQSFDVHIEDDTVFGNYSSANGRVYEYGYTDIAYGDSFARAGVQSPIPGTGDGGAKGIGGIKGNKRTELVKETIEAENPETGEMEETTVETLRTIIDNYPGKGTKGVAGASGCVVVYWDKVNET